MANARYVPRGHIGSEQALVLAAKAKNPERWRDEMLSPKEKEIYEQLGRTLNAELLGDHLRVILSKSEREDSAVVERLCDFEDAARWLRESLHAGDVRGRYLDENGKWHDIPVERWGADDGLDALLRGSLWLDEGKFEVSRLVLLAVDDLEAHCRTSTSNRGMSNRIAQRTISDTRAEQLFKAWRAQRGQNIPTEAEDCLYMKSFGVSRDRVRLLRAKVPNRARGKPKNPRA
ncbi:hypothetical protein [Bradyrhizobium sp. UFLA05-112]